ncbi:MAG: bifunctional 5,10-methylenetetrahydrofolate dehydrogenase/5,10-methenyltetrahydrofolate cyclohydrolase [Peptococcaceae bacterium]|nr:bifunctional 5,10-methylenetetrahydrofolate dehydrogenase/5,10-methenyltetrahydrofolate cyclohydrolase [Peptococcaceae bacterium]
MAELLDGKAIAQSIRAELRVEVARWRDQGILPSLAVILVGADPASIVYMKSKHKAAQDLGIELRQVQLPEETTEDELRHVIRFLNADPQIHGIMIELPLPKHINKAGVMAAIDPLKDVDGMHPVNRGYIMSGEDGLIPATPQSCIEILLRSHVPIAGQHAVIVGRGDTVGKPLLFLILRQQATVTVCHSRTPDLAAFTRQADILIAAVGQARLITGDMVKPGAVVVDAGINETSGGICGDVDYAGVSEVAGWISPVPGGVGSLTTVLLLRNLLKGLALQRGRLRD